jgi:predicted metal-binding membrane protein
MERTVAGLARQRRPDLRRLLLQRPELGASAAVVAAWVILVVGAVQDEHAGAAHAGVAGMAMFESGPAHSAWSAVAGGLPHWVLMTVAMMGPAALAGIRHTGLNSLRWRRGRAMAEFSAAYLFIWTAFGIAALAATALLPAITGWTATGLALAAAAAWQLTPLKRRWLRGCHHSVPLPPRGWRAETGSVRFGLRNGCSCLGSCWCLMLVMAVVPNAHLVWSAALTLVVTTERLLERPRRATRLAALALAVAAIGAVGAALA